MKKLLLVIVSILFINLLAGCNLFSSENTDIEATIVNETITQSNATIDVVINENKIKTEALYEVANKVANEVYVDHFDNFKDKEMELTINVYKNSEEYNNGSITFGSLVFYINQSEDNPGLSIKTNNLVSNN